MATGNAPVLFWKKDSPFSHWHPSPFIVGGLQYCCGEQWLMHRKALLFGDSIAADLIMQTQNPEQHKAFGRQVKGFDEAYWRERARHIAYLGNLAKFSQSYDLTFDLLNTGVHPIAEASPSDKLWGIGLNANDPRAQHSDQWQGENWLGQVLEQVRKALVMGGLIL